MTSIATFFAGLLTILYSLLGHTTPTSIDKLPVAPSSGVISAPLEEKHSSWIGFHFSTSTPNNVQITQSVAAFDNSSDIAIYNVQTPNGEEVWSVKNTRNGDYLERAIMDAISNPKESREILAVYDCKLKDESSAHIEGSVVALLSKEAYLSPTFTTLQPKEAWKVNVAGKFENLSTENVICNSNEADPE